MLARTDLLIGPRRDVPTATSHHRRPRCRPQRRAQAVGSPIAPRPRERKVANRHVVVHHALRCGGQRLVAIGRRREDLDVDAGRDEPSAQAEDAARRSTVPERRRKIRSDVQDSHETAIPTQAATEVATPIRSRLHRCDRGRCPHADSETSRTRADQGRS